MFRKEVSIHNLIPGEKYYAIGNNDEQWFRGVFSEYWTNINGYQMLRFHDAFYHAGTFSMHIGSREQDIAGLYWRVFEHDIQQSFRYYQNSRFNNAQKKELSTRSILRERRQYSRGLTGSTTVGTSLPHDIVREIVTYI